MGIPTIPQNLCYQEFLIKRGYCGHGCLMCPYDPKHTKGNKKLHAKNKKNIWKENKKV